MVALALLFTHISGLNGSASVVATVVASGAVSRRRALALAAVCALFGPLLFGVAVAQTVARDLIAPGALTSPVLIAALIAAIGWGALASWLGLPMSSTHAMVGGLAGASVAASGLDGVRWVGMTGVLIALVATPALGLAGGYLYMKLVWGAGSFFTPALNAILRRAQVLTSALVAVSYGTNEAQKGMGLILAALLARSGHQVGVPLWAQLASAIAIAGGVALGGSATLRTLGMRVFRIRPVHGFAAQATSAAIVIASTLLGGPTSMTQVATSAIFGVGAANRVTAVRWELGTSIVLAWLITLPATAVVAGALYWLTRLVA